MTTMAITQFRTIAETTGNAIDSGVTSASDAVSKALKK